MTGLMLRRVKAVYFDLYGTILDLAPLDAACEAVAPGRGEVLARAWRAEQLRLTWLRTIMGTWVDFEAVTSAALSSTAFRLGLDVASVAAVRDAFDHLPARPDAIAAIDQLRASGLRIGVLSNGSRAMLDRAVMGTGLGGVIDDVLSADRVRRYKPDPSVYDLAVQASGLAPADIGFVTANDWDAAGASACGLQVAWLYAAGPVTLPAVGARDVVRVTWAEVQGFATGSVDSVPDQVMAPKGNVIDT